MPHQHINRVVLTGNLTRDPELRPLSSGMAVCHLRVACNGRRRADDGGFEDAPNFFDVSVFGVQGENAQRYLKRGRPVAVDGRLVWREWETADHQRRQSVSIVADSVQFLGTPPGESRNGAEGDGGGGDALAGAAAGGAAVGGAAADGVGMGGGAAADGVGMGGAGLGDVALSAVGAGADEDDDLTF